MNGLRFVDSITDYFRSPKWGTNLLLGGVCMLIPVVGPLVIMGWLSTVFYGSARRDQGAIEYWRGAPAEWPVFDFARFVIYLQRGVWPFLVALVAGLALVPVMLLCMLPVMATLLTAPNGEPNGAAVAAAAVFSAGLCLVVVVVANVLLAPLVLRAYVLQDFKAAFSLRWSRDFLGRMWKDLLLVVLFTTATGLVFTLGGYAMLFVGVYFTVGIAIFSTVHLQRQLLDLYVQRGGEPLTAAPTLTDQPPPPLAPLPPPPVAT